MIGWFCEAHITSEPHLGNTETEVAGITKNNQWNEEITMLHDETDTKFISRLKTTDGLPTQQDAERYRSIEKRHTIDRIFQGIKKTKFPMIR